MPFDFYNHVRMIVMMAIAALILFLLLTAFTLLL